MVWILTIYIYVHEKPWYMAEITAQFATRDECEYVAKRFDNDTDVIARCDKKKQRRQ